jgi:uncharacterized beta-barrel protein YwiB (DUF1934 family)
MENDLKNVMITMKSVQLVDRERSEVELISEGTYRSIDGGYEITYEESEATGFEGSTTVMSCLGNDYASMTRKGSAPSELIIEIGKKHHCHYGTPYGDFIVGVYAKKIENDLDENGGTLYFKYTLDVNSSYISDNEVYVTVSSRSNTTE